MDGINEWDGWMDGWAYLSNISGDRGLTDMLILFLLLLLLLL